MNRNDTRAAAIGVTAGALTLAAVIAWMELGLDYAIAKWWARLQLPAAERAELDRITVADAEASRAASQYYAQDLERRAELDRIAALQFDPALLSEPGRYESLTQMTAAQLADEIAHTCHAIVHTHYSPQARIKHYGHMTALETEWKRRERTRWTLPQAEQLRQRIAGARIAELRKVWTDSLATSWTATTSDPH